MDQLQFPAYQSSPVPAFKPSYLNSTLSSSEIDDIILTLDSEQVPSVNTTVNPPSADDFESWVNDLFDDPDYEANISSPASLAEEEVTKVQFVAPAPAPIILSPIKPALSNQTKSSKSPSKKSFKLSMKADEESFSFDDWDEDYVDPSSTKSSNGKKRVSNTSINSLYNGTFDSSMDNSGDGASGFSGRLRKKLKGVTYHPESNRYRSRIKIGTRTTHLGYFFTETGAAKAYDRAAMEIRGSRASTNFPVEVGTYFVPPGSPRSRCIAAARSVIEDR